MDQATKYSNNKIIICTDFDKDLKLYRIPHELKSKLKKYKNIKIINFDYNNPECKKAEIYWGNLIDDKRIKFLNNLKWIHLGCVGCDKIKNLKILDTIKLTNSAGIMSSSVAESIFTFVFVFLRRFDRCIHLKNKKLLNRKNFDVYFEEVRNIKDCKFLIFGGGNISKIFISKLRYFSKNIDLVSSVFFHNKFVKNYGFKNFKRKKLNYDFVISILPEKIKYNNYFDIKFFRKMNKNSFFINVGRGSVVNEKDLIKCLSNNVIAGAGLDVFKNEPINHLNPLYKLDNCLITPHIAGLFNNYWKSQSDLFFFNLKMFFLNKKLKNIVKIENLYG